jgi:transposase
MWAVYIDAIRTHLPQATLAFDRFHITQHLNRAVDEVRRQTWRQMTGREKAEFKKTRFLWLSNPENLRREPRTRLSALLRLNSPIIKGYLLKETSVASGTTAAPPGRRPTCASGSGAPAIVG